MTTILIALSIALTSSFLWCLAVGLFLAVGKGR